MSADFKTIFSKLNKNGVVVVPASLKKHAHQGLMSSVYGVNSNRGQLIIHLIQPGAEWKRQRIWEKVSGIAHLLEKFPEIPTAEFVLQGKIGNRYFLVQKRLPGKPAGKRLLVNNDVLDVWSGNRDKTYLPQLQKLIAKTHKIRRKGYGWPVVKNGEVVGRYRSWRAFFEKELPVWLKSVKKGDLRFKKTGVSIEEIDRLVRGIIKHISCSSPVLIHGDAINPSNILVKGDKITGLLDWEWAMIGDPAWEFCDPGWWPLLNESSLRPYFKAMSCSGSQAQDLLKRARAYRLLWILWGSHLHAGDKNGVVYKVLRKMLSRETKALAASKSVC